MHLIVMVFAEGFSRVTVTRDIDGLIRQYRRRHGDFLPVAAYPVIDGAEEYLSFGNMSTKDAAKWYRLTPVHPSVQTTVFRQIRKLGAAASPLFDEWRRAVDSVKGVDV